MISVEDELRAIIDSSSDRQTIAKGVLKWADEHGADYREHSKALKGAIIGKFVHLKNMLDEAGLLHAVAVGIWKSLKNKPSYGKDKRNLKGMFLQIDLTDFLYQS